MILRNTAQGTGLRERTRAAEFFCRDLSRAGWDLSTLLQSSRITGWGDAATKGGGGGGGPGSTSFFDQRGYFNWAPPDQGCRKRFPRRGFAHRPCRMIYGTVQCRRRRRVRGRAEKNVSQRHPEVRSPLNGGVCPGIPERCADMGRRWPRPTVIKWSVAGISTLSARGEREEPWGSFFGHVRNLNHSGAIRFY